MQMPSAHLLRGVSRPWEGHTEQRFPGPNFHEGVARVSNRVLALQL
jgi:hypothetical protein